ncbi:MAG: nucleotidyltransferase family protein [Candidatus Bipolaricaulis sp.]|nr:nucleotidyltransferase family protein [Candidatus Bipolaricaulis sp.]MDD5218981.1 nucleotidyltransferase family protein [Candidatus Bipolaricaulis sp.]MDD5645973.1 nucleotidyltransferase family protein [Candidatus Bipolaricaulis sp.]
MIAGIVLAAGQGRRMGAVKPLIDIDGVPSLGRVLATLDEAAVPLVLVVLGREAGPIRRAVDLRNRRVVVNPLPERGMASSLALGLDALPTDAEGALVFHADMPFVRPETIHAVLHAAAEGAEIAAPCWKGRRGFPVFFRHSQWDELRETLHGDRGGRRFIENHPDRLRTVDVDDPGCIRDIDRPADLPSPKEASRCAMCE